MPLGIYISVPFCRTKCTFCNFASDVTSRAVYTRYVHRVCADIARSHGVAGEMGASAGRLVDSIYLGGGTPTVLNPPEMERIFAALHREFEVGEDAEVTVECAPGTLKPEMLDALLRCGVNRVSLGVQSFVDKETASVGRLHTRAVVLDDLARLRAAGILNISIDLIAGLPHQNAETWRYSLEETAASCVPHVSVYMLEVDGDSRLGRELIAGGARYHAHFVPDDDATADFYLEACDALASAGLRQYEISNFARDARVGPNAEIPAWHSRHNLKYWTRQPYFGFGVDAHSMLSAGQSQRRRSVESIRFSTPDTLEGYLEDERHEIMKLDWSQALEESWFLGLRLNRGVQRDELVQRYGSEAGVFFYDAIAELEHDGLTEVISSELKDQVNVAGSARRVKDAVRLTSRGRLLSNEVFEKFLGRSTVPREFQVLPLTS